MSNQVKILIAVAVFSILLVGGAVVLLSGSSSGGKAQIEKVTGVKIEMTESTFDWGEIDYDGGLVTHNFKIKNSGEKDLEIANMVTSCMCTKAYFKSPMGESPKFGMKGMSRPSSYKGILKPGEEGEIIVEFDPAYHGPTDVGKMERVISWETNDPTKPYGEVILYGNVIKK